MADLPDIKITELNPSPTVNTKSDYMAVVHYSDAYTEGNQTVKVHPSALLVYNNKKSKLNAKNYQDAIDEIVNLLAVGETFSAPLSPNPNANEIIVHTEPIQNNGG